MQIRTIRKGFEAFESKFEPFERDSKHSNPNSKYSNPNSKHSNPNSKHSNPNSKHSNPNLNHSKGIRSIRIQIRTTWKGFEAFECKFESFERDSKHSNANSNPLNEIQIIWMQILTVQKGFEPLESKFEPLKRDSKHWNGNSNLTLPTYQLIHPLTNSSTYTLNQWPTHFSQFIWDDEVTANFIKTFHNVSTFPHYPCKKQAKEDEMDCLIVRWL